jgi:hypothetical protein
MAAKVSAALLGVPAKTNLMLAQRAQFSGATGWSLLGEVQSLLFQL